MKNKITILRANQLVEDPNLYPRAHVDDVHVGHLEDAIRAGAEMPPLKVEHGTLRIVDGWHRRRALQKVQGEDAKVACILCDYASDKELFLEAGRLNAAHGQKMSRQDRAHFAERAMQMEIDPEQIATALSMSVDALKPLTTAYFAHTPESKPVLIKNSVRHMAGQQITEEQAAVIPKLGGNQQSFYANQLIHLIDSGLLDKENPKLMERLKLLSEKLNALFSEA